MEHTISVLFLCVTLFIFLRSFSKLLITQPAIILLLYLLLNSIIKLLLNKVNTRNELCLLALVIPWNKCLFIVITTGIVTYCNNNHIIYTLKLCQCILFNINFNYNISQESNAYIQSRLDED